MFKKAQDRPVQVWWVRSGPQVVTITKMAIKLASEAVDTRFDAAQKLSRQIGSTLNYLMLLCI